METNCKVKLMKMRFLLRTTNLESFLMINCKENNKMMNFGRQENRTQIHKSLSTKCIFIYEFFYLLFSGKYYRIKKYKFNKIY